ncbi:MAG TPA: tyrosine-protein phosphatase [Candidatus Limnocylindrales bacterium]|nr:tyrosine-protein phosphatase [Candidatus Limnocylindrales bacterium]
MNTRDLGGLRHPGGITRYRVLVRSDDVSFLTDAGREAMRTYGVATVIDLRSQSERNGTFEARFSRRMGDDAHAIGVTYLHHELVDDANLKRLGEASNMFERYLVMLNTRQPAFRDIFTSIAEAEGGVLFHCFAGKDRTGLVAALLLSVAGVPEDEIAADFGATDVQLAGQYEQWIAEASPDVRDQMRDELRCPPERILGVIRHLETGWGGAAAYLQSCGVSAIDMKRLATKLA